MPSHELIAERSRRLHAAIAAKVEASPELLEVARTNIVRWMREHRSPALLEWQRLLDERPLPEIVALLRSDSEHAVRLRQSSPFAGVLTPSERRAIFTRHDPRGA